MFRLIVFDLDGTLIDSRRDLADSVNVLLTECGALPLAEERVGRMVGDGAATLLARAFAAAGVGRPPDALQRFLAIYDGRLLAHTRAYDGISVVLERLSARSILAVLTNKPLAATRRILDGLGLAAFFAPERVLGGDGPFPRKPDPAGLMHLMRETSVLKSDTLLVGDSSIDWRTARAAGTAMCLARYGFGFEGFPVTELAAGDRVIDAPRALLDV